MTVSPPGVQSARGMSHSEANRMASHEGTWSWFLKDGWDLVRHGREVRRESRENWARMWVHMPFRCDLAT